MSGSNARILEVADLDLAYEPAPWAFAESRADEIAEYWSARKKELPRLFNGRVLLLGRHAFVKRDDGATMLRGAYFATDYSAFLAWRDFGFPDPEVCNCFSMAALQSSDGAYILGEMAPHTANGGSVYFASGTPDLSDIFDAHVDLGASARRELAEETGMSADEVAVSPGWTIVYAPPRIGCLKIMRSADTAENIRRRVDSFLARDADSELSRMHIVRNKADIGAINCPRFVADFLNYAFADR
jgi:hypothetical protein